MDVAASKRRASLVEIGSSSLLLVTTIARATFLLLLLTPITRLTPASAQDAGNVTIVDQKTHWDIVLDFEKGATHRQIGEELGEKIRKQIPQFEANLDDYIAENVGNWIIYKVMMHRVKQIKPQLRQEYRDEIEGIASRLGGGTTYGDGKISENELYMFNLLGDIARMYKCSALAVFGDRSTTGATIIGRNFDWPDGKKKQLTQLQYVTTIKNFDKSTVNVGCVAFQGAVSCFNSHGVFASVLDSPTGTKYSAKGKRSYLFDLRQALEENSCLQDVSNFMRDPARLFAFNHLIMLGDSNTAAVLENDIDLRKDGTCRRELRTVQSMMHPNASWDISDAIGSVNCFRLNECTDNHLEPSDVMAAKSKDKSTISDINTGRWESMKSQLRLLGPRIDAEGIKKTLSFYHPETRGNIYKGDLYNSFTMESIVFEPASFALNVAFRPRTGGMPARLQFESIPVRITPSQIALSRRSTPRPIAATSLATPTYRASQISPATPLIPASPTTPATPIFPATPAFAAATATQYSGPPKTLPRQLRQCETYNSTISGDWVWDSTSQCYKAKWENTAESDILVEKYTRSKIVFTRNDKAGQSAGLTARYEGSWDVGKQEFSGIVTWTWNGTKWKGTWRAR